VRKSINAVRLCSAATGPRPTGPPSRRAAGRPFAQPLTRTRQYWRSRRQLPLLGSLHCAAPLRQTARARFERLQPYGRGATRRARESANRPHAAIDSVDCRGAVPKTAMLSLRRKTRVAADQHAGRRRRDRRYWRVSPAHPAWIRGRPAHRLWRLENCRTRAAGGQRGAPTRRRVRCPRRFTGFVSWHNGIDVVRRHLGNAGGKIGGAGVQHRPRHDGIRLPRAACRHVSAAWPKRAFRLHERDSSSASKRTERGLRASVRMVLCRLPSDELKTRAAAFAKAANA